jgi:hypothetical protein
MSTSSTSTTSSGSSVDSRLAAQSLVRATVLTVLLGGVKAAAAGAVVLSLYGAVAIAVHGPMAAGDPGADHAAPVQVGSFAPGVVLCTFIGTLIALATVRFAARPQRTFVRVVVSLTAISLIAPLFASHTTEATRLILAGGHLLAATVVIPILTRAMTPANAS